MSSSQAFLSKLGLQEPHNTYFFHARKLTLKHEKISSFQQLFTKPGFERRQDKIRVMGWSLLFGKPSQAKLLDKASQDAFF